MSLNLKGQVDEGKRLVCFQYPDKDTGMKKECVLAWAALIGAVMLFWALFSFGGRLVCGVTLVAFWLGGGVWWSSNESVPMGKRILLLPLYSMTALMHLAICWASLLLGASWPKE